MMLTHGESASESARAQAPSDEELILGSGFFDHAWYLEKYPDVAAANVEPLGHFVLHGGFEGRHPGPTFDSQFYLMAHPELRAARVNPLLHYLREGRDQGWQIRPHITDEMTAVAQSGLFDPAWYLRRYPDLMGLGIDPFSHFIWYGAAEGRQPGPLFDSEFYRATYADVAAAGVVPLFHYLAYGRKEGRALRAVHSQKTEPRRVLPLLFGPTPPTRIACVVHAYYADVFEDLVPLFANLPKNFTLLVAVPSEEARSRAALCIAKHGLFARVALRIVPNRGRNFGSFLAEFSEEVLKHELLLHVHTKKSLYTGGEQTGWRTTLFKSLLGSKELVELFLGAFARDPSLGLVYPAAFENMPYWAYHWLGNSGQARQLMERLELPAVSTSGYLDYPVGGMFWARVDALRPLFEARLTYADFPEEAGQTDGTLAHVIERAVATISRARGYRFAEFDYDACTLRDNWSPRNLRQYVAHSKTSFFGLMADKELISFDVFDTLLCRPAREPDSVLRYVGFRLARGDASTDGFFEARKRAEESARRRKRHAGDVDLGEIYAALSEVTSWTSAQVEAAEFSELEMDVRILAAREGMLDLVKAAKASAKRVIAVSDSYYSRDYVMSALERAGYRGLIDHVYVSSREQARKDRGDLWTKVQVAEGVPRERWLHVGDNEHSDIQAACDRQIQFFHVMRPSTLLEVIEGREGSDENEWATDLAVGPAILRLAGNPRVEGETFAPVRLSVPHDAGYVVFGPLLFKFMAWLVSHPALARTPHVYFLSREGHLLRQAYEAIRARFPALALPPSTYFYTSRRALLSAFQAVRFAPQAILDGSGFTGSFAALLKNRIGFAVPEALDLARWEISLPRDNEFVLKALHQLRDLIVEHGASELTNLRAYCASVGMTGLYPGAVVDIGYSATIQKCLQVIQDVRLVGLYFATSRSARATEDQGGYAYGCFAEDFVSTTDYGTVVQHSLLVESFLTAAHGQVARFEMRAEQPVPVFKQQVLSEEVLHTLEELQGGAAAYCSELLDLYGPDLLFAKIGREGTQRFITMLVEGSLSVPAGVLDALRIEDDFCGWGVIPIGRRTVPCAKPVAAGSSRA